MNLIIYAQQYGGWWKMTADEWRKVLLEGIETETHELPRNCQMKRRSRLVGATSYESGEGHTSYYPLADDILVYSPLDWEEWDYREALKELDERLAKQ